MADLASHSESESAAGSAAAGSAADLAAGLVSSDRATRHAPAHTCSSDALCVIFSFLSLPDVASSALSCTRWSSAAAAAIRRRPDLIDTTQSVRTLRTLAQSTVRSLVREIDLSSSALVAVDRVESLWAAFPHLTSLTCKIDARLLVEETALEFPTSLRALDVTLVASREYHSSPWSHLDVLFALAVRCPLTHLRVMMPSLSRFTGALPVDALDRLVALRDTLVDLEFDVHITREGWGPTYLAVFRALTHLTRLSVGGGSWPELETLTAEPTTLTRLQSIDLEWTFLTPLDVASLARLPSLTQLHLSHPCNDGLALLAHLPHLATLHLHDLQGSLDPMQLASALATCVSITDLTLIEVQTTDEEAAALVRTFLPPMRRLRSLTLSLMTVDITCLTAAPHLVDTLESLDVDEPQSVWSLLHLRTLRRLQSARLRLDLSSVSDPPVELGVDDSETVFLPLLDHLRLIIHADSGFVADPRDVLGRLPALKTADLLNCSSSSASPTLRLLECMTRIDTLTLEDRTLSSDELVRVLSEMSHLRDLQINYQDDLSFLASTPHLARTLERLTLSRMQDVTSSHLVYLRTLRSLQYLCLSVPFGPRPSSGRTGDDASCESSQSAADKNASGPAGLVSLREMHLDLFGSCTASSAPLGHTLVDLDRLGPLPDLRTAVFQCGPQVHPHSIADALAHSTRLAELTVLHPAITDGHLVSALRPLIRLRSLKVSSAPLGGLSFASAVPHLGASLERLSIQTPLSHASPLVLTDLHHLRTLTQLRRLDISARLHTRDSDSEALDEFLPDKPNFRHDLWPYLHHSRIALYE